MGEDSRNWMSSLHLPINTAVSSSAGAAAAAGGSSSSNRNRGPSPASSSTHHEPKLLPQSPQDSPARGAAVARSSGHAGYVTGAGASPLGGGGGGRGSSDAIGDAAGTSTSSGPGSVAVSTWEIESHEFARKAPLATSLAPALLQKLIFGLGASFGFNALVVANGYVCVCCLVVTSLFVSYTTLLRLVVTCLIVQTPIH